MVQLAHAHAVDTRPFLPRRDGPGDEANMYMYTVHGSLYTHCLL